MECTQRLECTQDLNGTQIERVCPEQIGFLGICGKIFPIKKGPNKIGRDPSTCSIMINMATISRQHAVINVMNKNNCMLMDLDSANKTKLSGVALPPYIPRPLRNGDTVEFGDVFGVFRLLTDEVDLPMTQALDIPDTPVPMKQVSRINAVRTIPESPDVSDKEDSFIIQSQPISRQFPSPKACNFIKPGKTISIQPMGSKKIDNIYWNSSKKSTSLNLDDSDDNLNDSTPLVKLGIKDEGKENIISNDIHELETQMFPNSKTRKEEVESIYSANTQLPKFDSPASIHTVNTQIPSGTSSPSIHSLSTQLPCGSSASIHSANTQLPDACSSPSVYSLDTQLPGDNLPNVCKISEQQDLQLDLCADKGNSIYDAETQLYPTEKENFPLNSRNNNDSPASTKSSKLNTSNDEVLFEDIEEPFEGFESQAVLMEDIELPINRLIEPDLEPSQVVKPISAKRNMRITSDETDSEPMSQIVIPKSVKRNMRIKSNGSADCEDDVIFPEQKILEKKLNDDDSTDCEDDNMIELKKGTTITDVEIAGIIEDMPKQANVNKHPTTDDKNAENFEDMPTQVIVTNDPITDMKIAENFEDMPTQVIVTNDSSAVTNENFEDMLTQVLDIDVIEKNVIMEKSNTNSDVDFEDLPTQVLDEDFPIKKQPVHTKQLSVKLNYLFKIPSNSALKAKKKEGSRTPKIRPIPFITTTAKNDDNKYYQDTQEIYDDLCTQKLDSAETKRNVDKAFINNGKSCNKLVLDTKVIDIDAEEKSVGLVRNLTNEIASEDDVNNQVVLVKRVHSDGSNASDVENTPIKQRPLKFSDIDLPDSQEIKTSVSLSTRAVVNVSSSESETENNSEDQCTPIVFRKKKKSKPDVKLDLTKKFDLESLPTRVITRVRKPTAKLQDEQNKKQTEILKPKFLTEQDCEIDKEIIIENISRLKNKNDKTKSTKNDNPSKKSTEAEIVEDNTAENGKKMRDCRKKAVDRVLNAEVKLEKGSSTNDSKNNERRKRNPTDTKKKLDLKNQSSLSDKSTNKSTSIVDSDKAQGNKLNIETRVSTASPVDTKRSTRPRQAKTAKAKEISPEKDNQTEKPKRKYTRKVKPEAKEKEPSPEKEIRRSKRQLNKITVKKELPKSILKKSISTLSEVSAVYNNSSSYSDNRGSKRPSLDNSEAPSAKRTKSVATNNDTSRSTPAKNTQYVLFTAFSNEGVMNTLKNLGAVVVTDVMQSTVLLTKEIKRTFKLLCAVGLGKPIVGPGWVAACTENKVIVDPWQYLIKDEVAEKRFYFSLEDTLKGKRNFLKGYNISSTPSVLPNAHEMKLIVECSGGTWAEGGPRWVCVSEPKDAALWPPLRQRGATIVSSEFILGGVLRQRLDIDLNRFK